MAPHQARVVQEKIDLDDKIEKLSAFRLSTQGFELEAFDRFLLYKQLDVMQSYSDILRQRIQTFKPVDLKAQS